MLTFDDEGDDDDTTIGITLQHTATHRNTLQQHPAAHCNTNTLTFDDGGDDDDRHTRHTLQRTATRNVTHVATHTATHIGALGARTCPKTHYNTH